MASGGFWVVLCLGVLTTGVYAHDTTSTAVTAPTTVADLILGKIERLLDQKLDEKLSCGAVSGGGADHDSFASKLQLEALQAKLRAVEKQQEATESSLESMQRLFNSRMKSGSTFVHWGRKTCTNNSQVVYTGVAGGGHYTHAGASVTLLCLPLTPGLDEGRALTAAYSYLYGSEYEAMPGHSEHDVPCSVCLASQAATTIMIPATRTCPQGWTAQYSGHLVAGHYTHAAATEYTCLDANPEHFAHGHENKNGRLLYHVVTQCGSLPCPPYTNGVIVTCVVCSK